MFRSILRSLFHFQTIFHIYEMVIACLTYLRINCSFFSCSNKTCHYCTISKFWGSVATVSQTSSRVAQKCLPGMFLYATHVFESSNTEWLYCPLNKVCYLEIYIVVPLDCVSNPPRAILLHFNRFVRKTLIRSTLTINFTASIPFCAR